MNTYLFLTQNILYKLSSITKTEKHLTDGVTRSLLARLAIVREVLAEQTQVNKAPRMMSVDRNTVSKDSSFLTFACERKKG